MNTKLVKNCWILVLGAVLGRGLFYLAQDWGLMTASVLDIAQLSQIKNSGRDVAYKAEDNSFELFGSQKLPTQGQLQIQLQYNPQKVSIKPDSFTGYLESVELSTGLVDLVLAGYAQNPLDQHLFEMQFEGEEDIVLADAHFLDQKGQKVWLSVGSLSHSHHHDE